MRIQIFTAAENSRRQIYNFCITITCAYLEGSCKIVENVLLYKFERKYEVNFTIDFTGLFAKKDCNTSQDVVLSVLCEVVCFGFGMYKVLVNNSAFILHLARLTNQRKIQFLCSYMITDLGRARLQASKLKYGHSFRRILFNTTSLFGMVKTFILLR